MPYQGGAWPHTGQNGLAAYLPTIMTFILPVLWGHKSNQQNKNHYGK